MTYTVEGPATPVRKATEHDIARAAASAVTLTRAIRSVVSTARTHVAYVDGQNVARYPFGDAELTERYLDACLTSITQILETHGVSMADIGVEGR